MALFEVLTQRVGVPVDRATIVVAAGSGIIDIEGTLLRKLATAAAVAASASR